MLAPMAGITNLPMRLMARECGAALCFTEMVSVNGLVRDGRKTLNCCRVPPTTGRSVSSFSVTTRISC